MTPSNQISQTLRQRLQGLSPERRALLERKLKLKGLSTQAKEPNWAGEDQPTIEPRAIGDPVPLSLAQQRLWFLEQLEPGSSAYNVPMALKISGPLHVPALGKAMDRVVRRHESLRTTFQEKDGQPRQIIHEEPQTDMALIDLSAVAPADRDPLAVALAAREARSGFDLVRGPMFRFHLLRLDPQRHVLILNAHHLVTDGWSNQIWTREFLELYDGLVRQKDVHLAKLPIQYGDYAVWQRRRMSGPVREKMTDFWRNSLATAPPTLELPADVPRSAASFAGARHSQILPKALLQQLNGFCRRQRVTLFMALLAVYKILLHRYTGTTDLVIGTPVANRPRPEIESLIGFFVNTLALRTDLSGEPSFTALVSRTRESVLAAFAHQELPFEQVVEAVRPERQLNSTPIFQAMFALQNLATPQAESTAWEPLHLETGTAQCDLSLTMAEREDGLYASFDYRAELFTGPRIEAMLGHFANLLEQALGQPNRNISQLALMDVAERQRVLDLLKGPVTPLRDDICVHNLFEQRAKADPDRPALMWDPLDHGATWSYGTLNAHANELAQRLLAANLPPQAIVALCLETSEPDLIAALLAVFKIGCVYLPLDPAQPDQRLAELIDDSEAALVLTTREHAPRFGRWPTLVPDRNPFAGQTIHRAVPQASAAYTIYTSGSTGKPKGVMVPHHALLNHALSFREIYGLAPGERVLQMTNISFDQAGEEIFPTLISGATLVLSPPNLKQSFSHFNDYIARARTTVLMPTSAFWHAWTAELARTGQKPPACLRLLITGSDRVLTSVLITWRRLVSPDSAWMSGYGPTEATITSLIYSDAAADPKKLSADVPIGRLVHNGVALLLDRHLEPLPAGVAGELLLGGTILTRGYLGRPALTANSFIPHPYSGEPGARLYRTGDLARLRADGQVDFLGRVDRQIQLRGFRIEPGEVESALLQHPAVTDAVVITHGQMDEGKRLIAYVKADSSAGLDLPQLKRTVLAGLPQHMVPATVIVLEAMPINASGKIDRKALPEPGDQPEQAAYLPPTSPLEELVAGIWAEVLKTPRVGLNHHFFESGGHSLLAVQVRGRIREAIGIDMPLRDLFENPTLVGFTGRLAEVRLTDHGRAPLARIEPVNPRPEPIPLSFGQERLWFMNRLEPDESFYNMPVAIPFGSRLQPQLLARSFDTISQRHESMRTRFPVVADQPIQRIDPFVPITLPVIDLSGILAAEQEPHARLLSAAEASRPFDLETGPLFRARLLRLTDGDVCLATMHHIISDGQSIQILLSEMERHYTALEQQAPDRLPALPVQYTDFTLWQRAYLQGNRREADLKYWQAQLADAPPLLELPLDHARPAVQRFHGASANFRLPAALVRAVEETGRRFGTTQFMTLLTAFQALLGRYCGQGDISVGTPVAGRNRVELEGLIGFFVNTLVLRTQIADHGRCEDLLRQTRETLLAAHEHDALPFELLVKELQPNRSLSHSPLFQAMFSFFQDEIPTEPETDGQAQTPQNQGRTSKFDLHLGMVQRGGNISGSLEYNSDLLESDTIGRFIDRYLRFLDCLTKAPQTKIAEMPLLSAEERDLLLERWNQTELAYELEPLGAAFEHRARIHVDAVALYWQDRAMSYAELDRRADCLAAYLQKIGLGVGDFAGLCLEREPELIIAMLAILKCGAAYVPLDPAYPRARLRFTLRDARPAVLLSHSQFADHFTDAETHLVLLDQLPEIFGSNGNSPSQVAVPGELPAYLIYTSGSSGRPKGVTIGHGAASAMLAWAGSVFAAEASATVLASTSVCFDLSVFEIFTPLSLGGTILLVRDALALVDQTLAARTQLVNTVPSAMSELVRGGHPNPMPPTVNLAGEVLTGELVEQLYDRGAKSVFNLYGPSEDTTYSTFALIEPGQRDPAIGRPIANTRVYLVDRVLEPVPLGSLGELLLAGASLAHGYHCRPGQTADRFIPDPFSPVAGARLYRTGDRARYRPDGQLEFAGRSDNQVKLKGFRVELGEIERALEKHALILEAAVVMDRDRAGEPALFAYIGIGQQSEDQIQDLPEFLAATLPSHMVPRSIATLPTLPRTPNGKLDRRALPREASPVRQREYRAPSSPIEKKLASIWAEVLGLDRVGIEHDFFDLGGHSLLAARMAMRIHRELNVDLPLRALFETPTIARLAAFIQKAGGRVDEPPGQPLLPVSRGEDLPLSFSQQRLWFLDQLEPDSGFYNIPSALPLSGPLDAVVLAQALSSVTSRHEVLRTRFREKQRVPYQEILPPAPFPLQLVDLSDLDRKVRDSAAKRILNEDASAAFDLSRGPLLRARLMRLQPDTHLMLLTMHHIISDGWSMNLLTDEITAFYQILSAGEPNTLPPLPIQYADYSVWQRNHLQGAVLDAELAFWREQLAGAPPLLALPTDRPRPAVQSFRGAAVSLALPETLTHALEVLSRKRRTTLFMTLLAVFKVMLYRYSGQTDLVVGTPVAGRDRLEIEPLIGFFVNNLVLRGKLQPEAPFTQWLDRVRELTFAAQAHQLLPFEKMVEELKPERNMSYSPFFQVMFTLDRLEESLLQRPLVESSNGGDSPLQHGTAKYDLSMNLNMRRGNVAGMLEYNTDLFDEERIRLMAGHYLALLEHVVAEPVQSPARLEVMTEGERRQTTITWNNTQTKVTGSTIHRLIEARVKRHPDATALVFEGRYLTYEALNRGANRLARYLSARGIGPEKRVALVLERSPRMLQAMLAVLKTGAAYMPLDPQHPNQRLNTMIADAAVTLVIKERWPAVALAQQSTPVLLLDVVQDEVMACDDANLEQRTWPLQPAYVIYTSGSTGKPKGVVVPHGAVVNFMAGMDAYALDNEPGVWLAMTNYTFDISVFELLWTLTRGFQVVLASGPERAPFTLPKGHVATTKLDFSLFYFADDEDRDSGDRYRLLMEGARFGDRAGMTAVWTPERHFHSFGGLYPNPSVISAALAAITEHIGIRAGSVVLPLHSPVRVAEEWSVVDNLSKGRVGISFASGWVPDDFVLQPDNFEVRKRLMFEQIEVVRQLWRGQSVTLPGGTGKEVEVRIRPRPIQQELPFWVTAAGSPDTFKSAGALGANVLTHLLDQSPTELAEKIAVYHEAWRNGGHGGRGHVTLMIHTYLGSHMETVRETVRQPFRNYLRSSLGLLRNLAHSMGIDIDGNTFNEDGLEALLDHAFDRYFETSALFGTPQHCLEKVRELKAIGVDEIACLIDFGVDVDLALTGLNELALLQDRAQEILALDPRAQDQATLIRRHYVSHWQATPSMAQIMVQDPHALEALAGLKHVFLGGEALPSTLARTLVSAGQTRMVNVYGPTETTIWSTAQPLSTEQDPIRIGNPIANTAIYILDRYQQPQPIGVPGKLMIGGAGVVRGYFDRPGLTALRFVPDPFASSAGARLYDTGDQARWVPNGELEFLGRTDFQVKIRGHRIELGEIESVLADHAAIHEAVAVVREDQPGDLRLIGYLTPATEPVPSRAELRGWMQQRLPEYMQPRVFHWLKRLPLTPNGKVDRAALPALNTELESGAASPGYVEPRTPTEQLLAGIWEEVLRLPRVGVRDNFFELGGHSLLATQVVSRFREAFAVESSLRIIFETPDLAALAHWVDQEKMAGANLRAPAPQPVPRDHDIPLSFAQQRLWFMDQLEPGTPFYNNPLTMYFETWLEPRLLQRSFTETARRHETLRTTYPSVAGEPVQRIADPSPVPMIIIDFSGLDRASCEREAARVGAAENRMPFNLAHGPVLRTRLLRLSFERHLVLATMHHIMSDGWSKNLLMREVGALYEAFLEGRPSPLPDLRLQYADFAQWQRGWLSGEVLETHLQYWRNTLEDAPPLLALPTDFPRPERRTSDGGQERTTFPAELYNELRALSNREGATLFMTLLAAFQTLLLRITGQRDISLGTPISGRNHLETEDLIGFFVNMLVIRIDLSGNPHFLELLGRVRERTLDAYAHQALPFERLVEELQPERSNYNPLFQVLFDLQNVPTDLDDRAALADDEPEIVEPDLLIGQDFATSKFDLTLHIRDNADDFTVILEYSKDLFEAETATGILQQYRLLLEHIVEEPTTPLSQFRLSQGEVLAEMANAFGDDLEEQQ